MSRRERRAPNVRPSVWLTLAAGVIGFGFAVAVSSAEPASSKKSPPATTAGPHWRHPAAVVFSPDQSWLYTANQRSGSLSIVEIAGQRVVKELPIGGKPVDLVRLSGSRLAVVDEASHELILLRGTGPQLKVAGRLAVSQYPVDLAVTADGGSGYVASLWSRRVSRVELPADGAPQVTQVIDLPFAPRRQVLLEKRRRLIVGDSFGGRLAIIDTAAGKLLHVRTFPGHNIRGVGVSANGRMLLVAHQMLNELAHTVRNDVHWGLLMSNDLRWLKLDAVLEKGADLYDGAHMHPLGEANSATGDPTALAVSAQGKVIVGLGGVGELAIGSEKDFSLYRVKVGKRPVDAIIDRAGRRAYVANMFDDSISIVDIGKLETVGKISLGATPRLTQLDRGERLFFDARLSHDSWMSCNSCHTDGHTNGMLNDNFSDASFGAPKRVLSLMGRQNTEPFAWNASAKNLKEQIRNSIVKTMQSDKTPTDAQLDALAAYVATFKRPPPIDAARGTFDAQAVARGRRVFDRQKCARCHAPPTYTTPKTYDVGIHDKLGNQKFNPPTLRGVGQRGPYFHDNRAKTLRDVFEVHGHQIQKDLTERQRDDLVAFLRSL